MPQPPILNPDQEAELRAAHEVVAGFMGATRVAAFNGWTIGIFAGLSILFGLTSPLTLLIGVGLGIVARNEFDGRRRVRRLDPTGLDLLWRNQVGLMAIIIAYCGWRLVGTLGPPDPQIAELTELLGEGTDDLIRSLTQIVYASVAAATAIFQGLNARYYFIRSGRLRDYLRDTPKWVIELQRVARIE